ncbi:MAG: hypothetical protein KGZ30_00245 [Anaplasmataceae bacterium]|nr:hypothetical protein [Anaplasmataceae bacterium]
MTKVLVVYVPVVHQGYLNFFKKHQDASTLYLLGEEFIKKFFPLHKEIRALDVITTKKIIETFNIFHQVQILTPEFLYELQGKKVVLADEEVSRQFSKEYISSENIEYDSVFLRWDEVNIKSEKPAIFDEESSAPFDKKMMDEAESEAQKSADWWRQVGGVVVKDKKIIMRGHNTHLPTDHIQYIEGDPRDIVQAGTSPDIATSIHSEQLMVAEAARRGIALENADLYLTVFPCHTCAKIVATAGIKRCFFRKGNAYLDSERVFKNAGVKIIYVK